nr:MAG TPA: hypothetical protein [Caudoviricetes sp.]
MNYMWPRTENIIIFLPKRVMMPISVIIRMLKNLPLRVSGILM